MPNFECDWNQAGEPFPHFWENVIGSGHAPLALRADWQRQLKRCNDELGVRAVRFHGLLSSPMDTYIVQNDKPLYSFFNLDEIFDFLMTIGMRPFVELSFMPDALASGDKRVFHYASNVTPPADYRKWNALMRHLAKHLIARYGAEEVRKWHFEVWNEPNESGFWSGTQAEYFEMYRHTAQTLKDVDEGLQVGGPATSKNAWLPEFLEFCERHDLPVDFVSTHHYPTDSFGQPGDDTITQLAQSRRGVLREQAQTAKQQARGKPLFYTEWNSSSNPRDALHDEPYAAAFITKTIMQAHGLVEGYSFWTFSDIFQENYMPSVPFQGGFGLLNSRGIAKPIYRAFQLLHHLGDELLSTQASGGDHETVNAWAVKRGASVTILMTNHALPRHPVKDEPVTFRLKSASRPQSVVVERIDENHANPRRLWRDWGEPEYLSTREEERLHAASCVVPETLSWKHENHAVEFQVQLPPHAVVAVTLAFEAGESGD